MSLGPLDQARSMSISGASPSPSAGVKREDANRQSPAVGVRAVNGVPVAAGVAPVGYNGQPHPGLPNGHSQPVPTPGLPYDIKYRLPGKCMTIFFIKRGHMLTMSQPLRMLSSLTFAFEVT